MIELNFPNAVRQEKDFYGRQAELERIEQALCSGTRRPVAVYGERRMGKTSTLNVFTACLRARHAPQIVPLLPATVGIYSLEDFGREILQCLCEARDTSLTRAGLTESDGRFHLASVGQFLRQTRTLLQGSPVTLYVLCIDEFDALLHNCHTYGQEGETKKILDLSSQLITRPDLPLTLFITLTRMPDVIQSPFNTLVDGAERVDLSPLTAEQTNQLLEGILGDQVVLEASQRQQLHRLSGGHPYLLKLLLNSLLSHLPPDSFPLRVSAAILEQAVDDAAIDPHAEHVLGNILRVHFSPEERDLVTLMAGLDDRITQGQLDRARKEWHTAAKNLNRRGYLVHQSDVYAFRSTFLGHWLRQQADFEENLARLAQLRQRLIVEIEIDTERRQTLVRGQEVRLSVQQFQALSCLCQHVDRLVTKDQLADALWPQASGGVSDESIATLISRLRSRLGDDARHPRYIETVPGHGFVLHRAAFVRKGMNHD
ncbi:MAG: winged helix-turn-helix domain-containing protein [Anaerolineae bacterium]|jgi:DNA-binding response OmpR family regulator